MCAFFVLKNSFNNDFLRQRFVFLEYLPTTNIFTIINNFLGTLTTHLNILSLLAKQTVVHMYETAG